MSTTTTKRDETVADFTRTSTQGRDEWRTSEPRLPLFSVTVPGEDGDESEIVTYTYPAKPNSGLALAFLRQARKIGTELAISWLIEESVGAEGYDALVDELETYEGDGQEALRLMGEKLQKSVMGGLEGPKA